MGALEATIPYVQTTIQLNRGDLQVCYTDGVTEASPVNQEEKEFGVKRLQQSILKNRSATTNEILDAIITDVNWYSHNNISDDLTLLILRSEERRVGKDCRTGCAGTQ